MKLTGKDKNHLRGLGHHLKPILQIGKEGVSDKFISNIEDCLEHHELLKIKILEGTSKERDIAAREIEKKTGGNVVQIIGKTLLYYRPFKEKPVISFSGK